MSDSMREMPSEKTPRQHPVSDEQVKGWDASSCGECGKVVPPGVMQHCVKGGYCNWYIPAAYKAHVEQALAALQATLDTTIQESLKEITEVRARYEQMEQERDALKGALEESKRVLVIDNEYAADSNSVLAIDAALRGLASNRIVAAAAASQQQVAALEARNRELREELKKLIEEREGFF